MRDKFVLFILLTAIVGGVYLYLKGIIDFIKPSILVDEKNLKSLIGKNYNFNIKIKDDNSGIKEVKLYIVQNGENKLIKSIDFPKGIKEENIKVDIDADKYNLKKGEIVLIVSVSDRGLFENKTVKTLKFFVDPEPPNINILYSQSYIMNGGTAFSFLKVSEDVDNVYISMENLKFRCLSGVFSNNSVYTCVFPYPYYWTTRKAIYVSAVDKAGNITTLEIPYRFKLKKYKKSVINVTDRLMEKIRMLAGNKKFSDDIELFKYVNVEMRKQNEEKIHSITRNINIIKPLFNDRFITMKRTAVLGGFADYRKYRYKGKIIEGGDAYHKGLDMASVKNAKVPAAEDGVVVFAGFLGIYGNSIIIEHGLGVYTLYSHLLDFKVKVGDKVKKGQIIAHTDTTGLALGDHLHFGVLIQGLEVNPIEWLDRKWLKTRFFNKYKELKEVYGEN